MSVSMSCHNVAVNVNVHAVYLTCSPKTRWGWEKYRGCWPPPAMMSGPIFVFQTSKSRYIVVYRVAVKKLFFVVTSEAIRQWFSRVTKPRQKIFAESPLEWQKIVIPNNAYIIVFLSRYFMPRTHKPAKNNPQSQSIAYFVIVAKVGLF